MEGSFKDFEDVKIKATYNIDSNGYTIQAGETLAFFNSVEIAGLQEFTDHVSARGGYGNCAHVFWDTTKEIQLTFMNGVFTLDQFSLLYNNKLTNDDNHALTVSERELSESDENGIIHCNHIPINAFVYNLETGTRLEFTQEDNLLSIGEPYINVLVDYEYIYTGNSTVVKIGDRLLSGFVSLEGRTRLKDDITGQLVTGIIKIPKLKLMSDISMKLGKNASPVVATFKGVGYPVGGRGSTHVSEFYFLDTYLNSDI